MRGIYTDDLAALLKEDAGTKWRPSNGFEGDLFQEAYCSHCERWDEETGCPIAAATFFLDEDHQDYPTEWQIGNDGQPTCKGFNNPFEPDDRQLDMFAAGDLQPAPSVAPGDERGV